MILLKFLLGLVIFCVGLFVCFVVLILLMMATNLVESLNTKLKKHKPYRIFTKIVSRIFTILFIAIGIAFAVLIAYGIGDKLF